VANAREARSAVQSSLGFGLGLRHVHLSEVLEGSHDVQWFEALTENYLGLPGVGPGPSLDRLFSVRDKYPVVLHGVSLSIGGTDPLDPNYLKSVKSLIELIEPAWVSDHLCWTGVHGRNSHDLLPMPYTREVVQHIAARIQKVQETWRKPLLIENVSSYVEFPESEMTEWEFVSEVVKSSGCSLLLDVNNVYVSSRNHGFAAESYLNGIPWDKVVQMHLAGHTDRGDLVIDTHDHPVRDEVWALYAEAVRRAPKAATMVEWDADIPRLNVVEAELIKARKIHAQVTRADSSAVLL
jgi:uncharacterized protein (UPF0276 family)